MGLWGIRSNSPPTIAPTLTRILPDMLGVHVVPGSLSVGELGHDRNTHDETTHPEEDAEIAKAAIEGEGEAEVEELDVITLDCSVVPGVDSGSPIENVR